MFRTQHHQHLPEKRRLLRAAATTHQAVKPGHMFAWEFGEMLERHDPQPAATHAMSALLDKALALAG